MSDHGGSRTPSQASDHSSLGIFEDEEKADAFIQSLVTSDGLQSLAMRQQKRVGGVEQFVKKLKSRVDMIATGYVPLDMYQERVEGKHDSKISEFQENIDSLQDIQRKLTTSTEESEANIVGLRDRLTNQESFMVEAKSNIELLQSRQAENKKDTVNRIMASQGNLQGQADEIRLDISHLTDALKESSANQERNMEEFRKLKEYMMGEGLQQQVTKLVDDRLRGYVNDERMPEEQQKILAMVEERFIVEVRADIDATNQSIEATNLDLKHKDSRMNQLVRNVEATVGNLSEKQIRDHSHCMEELEIRAKNTELEDAETRLHNTIIQSKTDVDTLRNRSISKLNEFVDHLTKIQSTLSDHEHCLSHHAEELENRGTKYELLVAQNRIDKCVPRERYEYDVDEMKRILDWQTTKIEAYGMNVIKGKQKKFTNDPTLHQGNQGGKKDADGMDFENNEDDDQPPVQVLSKQLECLAMGVLGLSSLVLLKDPTVGSSRQKRLAQEQDLLGHLKSVRHWITHRQAPGGWDPKGLASVALKCAHGHPPTYEYPKDDTGNVLPQVTPRPQAVPVVDGKVGYQQASLLSTHMTSVESHQSSTTWPESSRNTSRNLPIKSSREQAYARIAGSGSPAPAPPRGNEAIRPKWGRSNGKVGKKDPEDFSGLFLESVGKPGQQDSQMGTTEGFAEMPSSAISPT